MGDDERAELSPSTAPREFLEFVDGGNAISLAVQVKGCAMIHWQPRESGRTMVVATILAIILGTTSVHAGWVYIEGTLDCGMWTKARGEQVATALEQYVLGLLNGLSLGQGIDFWRADGWVLSRDAVYAWMDNYCQKNPLEDVVPATVQLYKERSGWRPAVTTSSSIYVNPRPGK